MKTSAVLILSGAKIGRLYLSIMRAFRFGVLLLCIFFAQSLCVGFAQTTAPSPGDMIVAARLLTYVRPTYPATAKEGSFHSLNFAAKLGTDGKLHNLTPLGAPDDFQQAAIDAASQWVYVPYSLDGQPIEMNVVISVTFSSQEHRPGLDKPLRVSDSMMARLVDKQPQPTYPQTDAKGSVVLSAIIGKDGRIGSVQVVSGPAPLQSPSLDAARQWIYKPYLFDGVPVEVQTTITFNFSR
jgi:hypothetical protein